MYSIFILINMRNWKKNLCYDNIEDQNQYRKLRFAIREKIPDFSEIKSALNSFKLKHKNTVNFRRRYFNWDIYNGTCWGSSAEPFMKFPAFVLGLISWLFRITKISTKFPFLTWSRSESEIKHSLLSFRQKHSPFHSGRCFHRVY
jgi:hypothetical protein